MLKTARSFPRLAADAAGRRGKSLNSHEWLERKLKDPYVEKARMENYRCRSAFKLIEIDDRFKILKPGQRVIDIGAAPGSWSQVLVKRTNSNGADAKKPKGFVVSVDKSPVFALDGAVILSGADFTDDATRRRIAEALSGERLDFVFSDMAPNASGVRSLDNDRMRDLAFSVLEFAVRNLRLRGGCLVKIWGGGQVEVADAMRNFFERTNVVRPEASHRESAEVFLLARNFRGVRES